MTTFTVPSQVLLNAPPAEVFAYVSDLTRHSEWSGGPLKIERLTLESVAVGSQYRSKGGESERVNELRVTEYQPPTRFTFVATDAQVGELTHEFTFEDRQGQTLMVRNVTGSLPLLKTIVFRLFIYPNNGKPMMAKALAKLKAKWEPNAR